MIEEKYQKHAKMLAKIELIASLHDARFISVRETRTGLYSMPPDFNFANGQLAASTMLQMQLEPSIVQWGAYCESSYPAGVWESGEGWISVEAQGRVKFLDPQGDCARCWH